MSAGLRDAWRVRGRTALFAAMVTIGTVLTATGLSELGSSVADVRVAEDLGRRGATFFRVHYLTDEPFEPTTELAELLDQELRHGGAAFTTVRFNHGVRETFPYPVLLVLGDFEDAFGLPEIPDGSAVVGEDVALYGVGDTVDLGVTTVEVSGRLAPGAVFLDPWQSRETLARTVVVKVGLDDLMALGWPAQEEAVARTVLLAPTTTVVDRLVDESWSSGLQLVPATVADAGGQTFASHQRDSLLYTAMYTAFLLLVVVAVGSSAAATARRAQRSLAIQRLHGARIGDVVLRLATYLALVVLVPVLGVLGLAALALPDLVSVVPWAIAAVTAVYAGLVARVSSVVARNDLAAQLGGSNL
ncbi:MULTISPECIES: hypothetical protein [unclassified Actinotalea]|uniref:hypothetical protein n=1 Tax=unclassified Actinotalea TaxID=2638618 RepID=UPI0015F7015F|nr:MULTISPECIES: hypothetical protein [unclassified Actinotalea]